MAKKKAAKRQAKKRSSKPAAPAARAEPVPQVVVFYELEGVAGVRFQGEFADIQRARIVAQSLVAQSLVASSDVAQAWILRDLEIIKKPSG